MELTWEKFIIIYVFDMYMCVYRYAHVMTVMTQMWRSEDNFMLVLYFHLYMESGNWT